MFGMVISYTVKVKLYLGAMGGEVTAELPFVLMHPKVSLVLYLVHSAFYIQFPCAKKLKLSF